MMFKDLVALDKEVDREIEQLPSIKVIEASSNDTSIMKVLLDGGASHDVYHSRTIPEGSVEKDVELAHGLRKGYVKRRRHHFRGGRSHRGGRRNS